MQQGIGHMLLQRAKLANSGRVEDFTEAFLVPLMLCTAGVERDTTIPSNELENTTTKKVEVGQWALGTVKHGNVIVAMM